LCILVYLLSNGYVTSGTFILARVNTTTDGGRLLFQKADGNPDMFIDAYYANFRFVYNNQIQFMVMGNASGISNLVYFGGYNSAANGYTRLNNGFLLHWIIKWSFNI